MKKSLLSGQQIVRPGIRQVGNQQDVMVNNLKGIGLNKNLVIIANGPSHKEVDLSLIKNVDFMCINKPDERVWPSKFWAFSDISQYDLFRKEFDLYKGIVINTIGIPPKNHQGQIRLKTNLNPGFSFDLNKEVHIGRSTTYVGLQVGVWAGYKNIFIFGVDMNETGKLYPWGSNLAGINDKERRSRFKAEEIHWTYAANSLSESIRKSIYFCSKHNKRGFLEKFNKLDQDISVEKINEISNTNSI